MEDLNSQEIKQLIENKAFKYGCGDSNQNEVQDQLHVSSVFHEDPYHLLIYNGPLFNDVILRKLFGMMNLEVLKACRQVCRKWDSVIDSIFKARVNMLFGFDDRITITFMDMLFCKNERQCHTIEEQILDYELLDANTDADFTSFKFEGENIPWQGDVLQQFFKDHGGSMKELSVTFDWSITNPLLDDFFDFVNLLLKYAFKIEVLRIVLHYDSTIDEMVQLQHHTCKKFEYCQPLLNLKVFSLKFSNTVEEIIPRSEKNIFDTIVRYILGSSKNLRKIIISTSSPMILNAARFLTKESYGTLKDLHYNMSYYSPFGLDISIPPDEPRFGILLEMSKAGLQLGKFSVELEIKEERAAILQRFIKFLETQKHLEKMEIYIVCFPYLRPFFPKFPKMEKLQTLKIRHVWFTSVVPFEDKNLSRQFPALNLIEITVTFGIHSKESIVKLVRNFLKGFDIAGENLQYFHVCISVWRGEYYHKFKMSNVSLRKCVACFKLAKLKIPNLKQFKISLLQLPNMVSYNGKFENSVVVPLVP